MRRFAAVLALVAACRGVAAPTPDELDAGEKVAGGLCSAVEALDDAGIVQSLCATVDEVGQMLAFIMGVRSASPPRGANVCAYLPGTNMCATAPERVRAIQFVRSLRAARDAGRTP